MARSLTNDQLYELRLGEASFGSAVEALKQGYRISRVGWHHGKEVFAFLVNGSKFKVNRAPLNTIFEEGTQVSYRPHIDIKNENGEVGVWSPTTEDILAGDWYVVEKAITEAESEDTLKS